MSGTSKTGNPWNKQEYVLETIETYPKKVHFDFFGERANQYPLNEGDTITLSFDIESREYQGRWYTSIRGWKAVPWDPAAVPASPQAAPAAAPVQSAPAPVMGAPATEAAPAPDLSLTQEDDLPF